MNTLLIGLMLAATVFGIVTLAGSLIWFWKNRQRLPRWHESEENSFQQKDYFVNHQSESPKSRLHQYPDKINRAA